MRVWDSPVWSPRPLLVSTHWQVQELRCITHIFLFFCCLYSMENILRGLFQNLFGVHISVLLSITPTFWVVSSPAVAGPHSSPCTSASHQALPSQTESLFLLRNPVLSPVAYNPSTAPVAFGMHVGGLGFTLSLALCCPLCIHN